MKGYSSLSLGEKICMIRKAKGLSQDNVAHVLNTNRVAVSRLENGETEWSAETLTTVKDFLDIKNAPLLEHELRTYENRLQVWIELIIKLRFAEASTIQEEMSVILDLPFEEELYLLYVLAEASILTLQYQVQAADEKLSTIENLLDNASNDALNLYHRNKGFIRGYANDLVGSIKHSTKAVQYADADNKTDGFALINIGHAYMFLGKPYHAIQNFVRAEAIYQSKGDITTMTYGVIMNALGSCYLEVGEYRKAEELTVLAISHSKSVKDNLIAGAALYKMARLKLKMKMYDECMDFCEQVLVFHKESGEMIISALILKASCLLEMKKFSECQELIGHIKNLLNDGKQSVVKTSMSNDDHTVRLNAIGHLMTLDNPDSITYILDTAIPHLRAKGSSKFEAIYFCNKLETHYTKKRAKTKANAIAAISRDILLEIYHGEIEFD